MNFTSVSRKSASSTVSAFRKSSPPTHQAGSLYAQASVSPMNAFVSRTVLSPAINAIPYHPPAAAAATAVVQRETGPKAKKKKKVGKGGKSANVKTAREKEKRKEAGFGGQARAQLHTREKVLDTNSLNRSVARLARGMNHYGLKSRRNVLGVTRRVNGRNKTLFVQSAGMGGLHPRSGGASASHTEQQIQALRMNPKYKSRLSGLSSIASVLQPCSHNSSNPMGCRSIPIGEMGGSGATPVHYLHAYPSDGDDRVSVTRTSLVNSIAKAHGVETREGRSRRDAAAVSKDLQADDSDDDEFVDADVLRGEEVPTTKKNIFS